MLRETLSQEHQTYTRRSGLCRGPPRRNEIVVTVDLQLEEEVESRNRLERSSHDGVSTLLDIESSLSGTNCLVEPLSYKILGGCGLRTSEVEPMLGF